MQVRDSLLFFTFWPLWLADRSSWGPPQSIFFPGVEDSYARFNLGQKVATGAMFGVLSSVDRHQVEEWRGTNGGRGSSIGADGAGAYFRQTWITWPGEIHSPFRASPEGQRFFITREPLAQSIFTL